MSAPHAARAGRPAGARVTERLEVLGLRAVLLAYWGTVSVLSVLAPGGRPPVDSGESVRPKG